MSQESNFLPLLWYTCVNLCPEWVLNQSFWRSGGTELGNVVQVWEWIFASNDVCFKHHHCTFFSKCVFARGIRTGEQKLKNNSSLFLFLFVFTVIYTLEWSAVLYLNIKIRMDNKFFVFERFSSFIFLWIENKNIVVAEMKKQKSMHFWFSYFYQDILYFSSLFWRHSLLTLIGCLCCCCDHEMVEWLGHDYHHHHHRQRQFLTTPPKKNGY